MKPRAAVDALRVLCGASRANVSKRTVLHIIDQIDWSDHDDGGSEQYSAGEFEQRVREELAKVAPPGTAYTPELEKKVRDHMMAFIMTELRRIGLPEAFATLIAASVKIKQVQ